VGGSDVAAACGLSRWKTPYQLWLEKTGRVTPTLDDAARERTYWGRVLEPLLLSEWDERHPEFVLTGGDRVYRDREHEWMLANVDGLVWTPDQELAGVLEAKTGNHRTLAEWDDNQVPVGYVCQVQWYLRILDAPRAFVVALLDTNTYVERVIERDDDLITELIETASEFWDHVERDEPPPVDGTEGTRLTLSRWPATPGTVAELDPLWGKHITRRRELSDEIKALLTERDRIDNELRATMGQAEHAELNGVRVATHKTPSKPSRSMAYDAFHEAHPDLYPEFVSEKPAARRLTYTVNPFGRDQK
jgi:putative phage-type endonuclease